MKCKRCNNEDQHKFYKWNKRWYCRNCISFGRIYVDEDVKVYEYEVREVDSRYHLDYQLTSEQQQKVKEVNNKIKEQSVLLYAACGAGKTEIAMDQIQLYLSEKKKVGYAISRRQVVLEIAERLQAAFTNIVVTPVCGGYTKITEGDLIVCTMHQLHRYHKAFDLLIMDEIDAFPYAGNDLLETIAHNACKGKMLMLTATPSEELINQTKKNEIAQVTLFKRPHGYCLVEPIVYLQPVMIQYFYLFSLLMRYKKQKWIVFLPTIHAVEKTYQLFRLLCSCQFITSKSIQKDQCMQQFHDDKFRVLFATTILERGITISGVNVCILNGEHCVYKNSSLIQMVGRVGRKKEAPTGFAYILTKKRTKAIQSCIEEIKKMNKS